MRERPILFSGPMVRAILEGRKTQTRRVVKPQPFGEHVLSPAWGTSPDGDPFGLFGVWIENGPDYPDGPDDERRCPYGVPGDRLWVRETWTLGDTDSESWAEVYFRADGEEGPAHRFAVSEEVAGRHAAERERLEVMGDGGSNWKPSIYMPRWSSRLTLEVKAVRVERLQEISEADAIAEGAEERPAHGAMVGNLGRAGHWQFRQVFRELWDSINAKRGHGWETNTWVWVVEFKKVKS